MAILTRVEPTPGGESAPPNALGRDGFMYDWNRTGAAARPDARPVHVLDETLRDGLQSPSVTDPATDDKLAILRAMDGLGVEFADLGLPGAGARQKADLQALVETIRDEGLGVRPAAAARTLAADIAPIIDVTQATGVPIEVLTFLGASPIRTHAEGWKLRDMRVLARDAVRMGVRAGLPVSFVTEDTVRSAPEVLEVLFETAIAEGATRIVLCDTVGHATPSGVRRLVLWTRALLVRLGVADTVGIDFHGHNDRGLAVVNSLTAMEAGCDRLHGTALGMGERVGNAALDQLLVNLVLMGSTRHDLSSLLWYCQLAARATGQAIPANYPVVGQDAFRTGTGVHAAAIVKASRLSQQAADAVYSGVPAALVGRQQEIEVGPMSGEANVLAWLASHGFAPNPALVAAILERAKRSTRTLRADEIQSAILGFMEPPGAA